MQGIRKNPIYFVERYVRIGEMPLFLIFCRDRQGMQHYCVMLNSLKKLRQLVRMRRGFSDPMLYGNVLCIGRGGVINDAVRHMLKARYDFDLENCAAHEIRLF